MEPEGIKSNLIAVIEEIQKVSGLDCPKLDGKSHPAIIVPEFRSPLWAVAATLLSERLGAKIPDDANLFYDVESKKSLSIDESIALVGKLIAMVPDEVTGK